MGRWERRLARLEKLVAQLVRLDEERRTRPARVQRWRDLIEAQELAHAEREQARREAAARERVSSRGPEPRDPDGPVKIPRDARDDTPVVVSPPAPPPPLPEPLPRPAVEFIGERAGMSIAIDTATGQMASSAQVLAALNKRSG